MSKNTEQPKESYRAVSKLTYRLVYKLVYILSVLLPESMQDTFVSVTRVQPDTNAIARMRYAIRKLLKESSDEYEIALSEIVLPASGVLKDFGIYDAYIAIMNMDLDVLHVPRLGDFENDIRGVISKPTYKLFVNDNGPDIRVYLDNKYLLYKKEFTDLKLYNKIGNNESDEMPINKKVKKAFPEVEEATFRVFYKFLEIMRRFIDRLGCDETNGIEKDASKYVIKNLIDDTVYEYLQVLEKYNLAIQEVLGKDLHDVYVALSNLQTTDIENCDTVFLKKTIQAQKDFGLNSRYLRFAQENWVSVDREFYLKSEKYYKLFGEKLKENNEMKVDVKEPLDYSKPIRSKHTKTPYKPVGESGLLSNGSRVFELPPDKDNPEVSKIVVIPENELDTLENYVVTIPDSYTLYLREREDGSRYITSDGDSVNADKIISTVWVDYTENNIWKVQGVNKNNR